MAACRSRRLRCEAGVGDTREAAGSTPDVGGWGWLVRSGGLAPRVRRSWRWGLGAKKCAKVFHFVPFRMWGAVLGGSVL